MEDNQFDFDEIEMEDVVPTYDADVDVLELLEDATILGFDEDGEEIPGYTYAQEIASMLEISERDLAEFALSVGFDIFDAQKVNDKQFDNMFIICAKGCDLEMIIEEHKKIYEKDIKLVPIKSFEVPVEESGMSKGMSVEDIAKKHKVSPKRIEAQVKIGMKIEKEHTDSDEKARRIALDHLFEIPDYYNRLVKMEKEAGLKESKQDLGKITERDILDAVDKLSEDEDMKFNSVDSIENDASVIFITPSGAVLDASYYETHGSFLRSVYGYIEKEYYIGTVYEYCTEELGFITLNTGDGFGDSDDRCKVIVESKFTPIQATLVQEWLSRRTNETELIVYCNGDQKSYDLTEEDPASIIKKIRKCMTRGILEKKTSRHNKKIIKEAKNPVKGHGDVKTILAWIEDNKDDLQIEEPKNDNVIYVKHKDSGVSYIVNKDNGLVTMLQDDITEENELSKRAKKHKKTDKKGAKGWFVNPSAGNVEYNIAFFNKAMGNDAPSADAGDAGAGMGESVLVEVLPHKGETKEAFISRFMSETVKEYPNPKQRYAVALSYWEKK